MGAILASPANATKMPFPGVWGEPRTRGIGHYASNWNHLCGADTRRNAADLKH